ncbi:MAG TPA: hypothetical protein DD618_02880 [Acholeplasmatales bacterium]|nr:hypothetical protein [Acholeplasmatales bacterium]
MDQNDGHPRGCQSFGMHRRRQLKEQRGLNPENCDPFEIDLDIFFVADLEGHFLKINFQFEKALGFSFEQLKTCRFFDLVHEEDRTFTKEAVQRVAKTEELGDFVSRCRAIDDRYVYLEWRAKKAENMSTLRLGT